MVAEFFENYSQSSIFCLYLFGMRTGTSLSAIYQIGLWTFLGLKIMACKKHSSFVPLSRYVIQSKVFMCADVERLVLFLFSPWKHWNNCVCSHWSFWSVLSHKHKFMADAITMATVPARGNWIRGYFKSSATTTTATTWWKSWVGGKLEPGMSWRQWRDVWQYFTLDLCRTIWVWNNSRATTIKTCPSCEYIYLDTFFLNFGSANEKLPSESVSRLRTRRPRTESWWKYKQETS